MPAPRVAADLPPGRGEPLLPLPPLRRSRPARSSASGRSRRPRRPPGGPGPSRRPSACSATYAGSRGPRRSSRSRRKSPWYLFSTAVTASSRVISSAATAAARSRACTSSAEIGSSARTHDQPGQVGAAGRDPEVRASPTGRPPARSARRAAGRSGRRRSVVGQRGPRGRRRSAAARSRPSVEVKATPDAEDAAHLGRDAAEVAALEHDLGQPGVQRVDPRQRRAGELLPVTGYQHLHSLGVCVGTTSHRQTVTGPDSVGKVIPVSAPPRVRAHLLRCGTRRTGPGAPPRARRGLRRGRRPVRRASSRAGATAVPCALRTADRRPPPTSAAAAAPSAESSTSTTSPLRDRPDRRRPGPRTGPHRVATTPAPAARRGRLDGRPRRRPDPARRRRALRLAGRAPGGRRRRPPRSTPPSRACLDRTTLLSATLLDCALHGEVIPEFAALRRRPRHRSRARPRGRPGRGRPHLRPRAAPRRPPRPHPPLPEGAPHDDTRRHVELRPGAYADSVTLLQVSRAVQGLDGVLAAQVAMATALNLEVLAEMGFDVPAEARQRHGRGAPARPTTTPSPPRSPGSTRRCATPTGAPSGTERGRAAAHDGERAASLRRSPRPARSSSSRCPARAPWSRRWTRSTPATT